MRVLKNTIKECRKEKHINQQELADCVGITRETVGKLERGQYQNPTYQIVFDLATFFEKPVEEIFHYEEE